MMIVTVAVPFWAILYVFSVMCYIPTHRRHSPIVVAYFIRSFYVCVSRAVRYLQTCIRLLLVSIHRPTTIGLSRLLFVSVSRESTE